MSIREYSKLTSMESPRRSSLNSKVRVRTSQLPRDFFGASCSKSKTRPSSASKSFREPQTPTFGKRDFSLVEEK